MSGSVNWLATTLESLLAGQHLDESAMGRVMDALLRGECGEAETAALLVALRAKGETPEELAAAARALRRHCQALPVDGDVLDTCGTGGDGQQTFNISTATALVVAAAGVRVVKHGNRGISSASGSADVLAELGVQVSGAIDLAQRCLRGAGMAFCMAPLYHPALRHVGDVRRRLGVRTLFNCLGPLANPACAPYQLLGVGRLEWLDKMAGALASLGIRQAYLVHSRDGLDEVSLSAPTLVRRVRAGGVTELEWSADDFGLEPVAMSDLRVDGAKRSAAIIRGILAGDDGPPRRIILANAAAALLAAEAVTSLRDGVQRAADALDDGRAAATLAALVALSNDPVSPESE